MKDFGLNLYSIRNLISTEEDFLNTALTLKKMGYSSLQYSGAAFEPERIKRVVDATGMPVVLTHVPMDRIIDDTDKLMEEHAIFGCKNVGLGAMPFPNFFEEKLFKDTVDKLAVAAEKMAKNGYNFTYHHHHYEMYKFGDKTGFDYVIESAPYINFTVDTYWLQYGGADILSFLDRVKGRVKCVHLKDYQLFLNKEKWELKPDFAPCGDGTLDFVSIIKKMQDIGVEHFLVEQDNACDFDNELELVERSANYIKKLDI